MASLFSGIIYKVHYKTILNWDKTYIFCANHSSNLDIFALSATLKGNYFFMGKHELLDSIFTRRYFQTIDIPVDRESKIGAYRALKKAEQRLQDGLSLVIFPEGAIEDHYPPRLMPFKNGTFKLAIENKVAIVPVSLRNNWELLWDDGKKYGSKPGISHIYVHEPIETIGLTLKDEENLKNKVFEIVHSKLSYNK
ncbi:lysophospholipid acyltransferase family protein [Pseudopedobacter beijingensis]|uniref:Lysophospholipid acyltransferase family protein n=1 Tax=Pseudopedobacter beijingensis TaxID=1207056 RepID=A0ABW4I7Y3_9SPHI